MSIELEWDVSEAPHDNEGIPHSQTDNPTPSRTSQQPDEPDNRKPYQSLIGRWPRAQRWLASVALLVAMAGGALWYFTHAGWQKVNNDLVSAANYEDKQASEGAANLLLNVQDRGNMDWLAVRRDEAWARQPAPLPVPMLSLDQTPLEVADVTVLDTEFVQASVNRKYSTPDGQTLTITLPQIYRRDSVGDWLRSAPPGSFWGNWLDWRGAQLAVRYSERDAAFVNQVAPTLDKRLADACSVWAGGCPSQTALKLYLSGFVGSLEYNPLSNVEVRIELANSSGGAVAPADYFLSIPSPQIAGIPTDEAGRSYLADYLAVRLIASLARHISTSPDGYYERTSQAIKALDLARADPGYLAAGDRRRHANSGAALLFAEGNNRQAPGQPGIAGP
jgi:hypothetical protein